MKKIKWNPKIAYVKGLPRAEKICHEEFIKWLRKEIKRDWGHRCDEYQRACAVCEAWKAFDIIKFYCS